MFQGDEIFYVKGHWIFEGFGGSVELPFFEELVVVVFDGDHATADGATAFAVLQDELFVIFGRIDDNLRGDVAGFHVLIGDDLVVEVDLEAMSSGHGCERRHHGTQCGEYHDGFQMHVRFHNDEI